MLSSNTQNIIMERCSFNLWCSYLSYLFFFLLCKELSSNVPCRCHWERERFIIRHPFNGYHFGYFNFNLCCLNDLRCRSVMKPFFLGCFNEFYKSLKNI
jgi:hypothetical protein